MNLTEVNKKKKLSDISHGKPVRRNTPLKASQSPNGTKLRTNIEKTKENLRQLAKMAEGYNQVEGFLFMLWDALGVLQTGNGQQRGGNPSRYTAFQLNDGSIRTITIRASAHNTKAKTYTADKVIGDMNLSIVLQTRRKKNTFEPNEDIVLEEYVYVNDRIANVENPLSQIALGLVGYLETGTYKDTTNVAFIHYSPFNSATTQNITIDRDNNAVHSSKKNCGADYVSESRITNKNKKYKNMNRKNTIRLTEPDLHQIIKESVNNILSELDWKTYANAAQKRAQQADENPNKPDLRKKSYDLANYANNILYIDDYKYDTLGDKMNSKKSAKFDAYVNPMSSKMSYGTVRGWNNGGNEIFSTDKGVYHNSKGGLTTPGKHFRNNDVANAYSRANDELWDYEKGNYDYQKGKGWVKK